MVIGGLGSCGYQRQSQIVKSADVGWNYRFLPARSDIAIVVPYIQADASREPGEACQGIVGTPGDRRCESSIVALLMCIAILEMLIVV